MCTPVQVEMVIGMLSAADPDQPADTWDLLRQTVDKGYKSIDQRLEQYGPLEPERFSLQDANQGLVSSCTQPVDSLSLVVNELLTALNV